MAKYFTTVPYPVVAVIFLVSYVSANFYNDFDIPWGSDHVKVLDNGSQIQLSLDKASGSAIQSKKDYLFGKFEMQMKLVSGNSAGTVTTFYLSSEGPKHDEIDFEFLGNLSGDPYTLHTNIFSQGLGNREQQFSLWFDPTAAFHTYSVLWDAQKIIFLVDGSPIRVFHNSEDLGVPYPNKQAMKVYSSLWNGEDWATRGGLVKTDWTKAPFVATHRNFNVQSCNAASSSCSLISSTQTTQILVSTQQQQQQQMLQKRLRWLRKNFMIYNYCTDSKRFPNGSPEECTRQNLS